MFFLDYSSMFKGNVVFLCFVDSVYVCVYDVQILKQEIKGALKVKSVQKHKLNDTWTTYVKKQCSYNVYI